MKAKEILKGVKNYLSSFFQSAMKKELDILIPMAIVAVKKIAADTTLVTNAAKRSMAFTEIKDSFVTQNMTIADSLVNLAIELAVAEIKSGG